MQKIMLFLLVLSVHSAYSMEQLTDAQRAAIMNLNLLQRQLAIAKEEGLTPDAFFRNCEVKKQQFSNDAHLQQAVNKLIGDGKAINAQFFEKKAEGLLKK